MRLQLGDEEAANFDSLIATPGPHGLGSLGINAIQSRCPVQIID